MTSQNKILAGIAAVLLILSVISFRQDVAKAERFERGQKFLPNLNPDVVADIYVGKGDKSAHLVRRDDKFVVASLNGYPAKNESINRFLRDVLEISLEKEVGSSESLQEELEVKPGSENALEVILKNEQDKELVRFYVGKSVEDGNGNYVMRADRDDKTIYLTSSGAFLSHEADNFLDKELVDVKQDEILRITGSDYVIEDEEGSLKLKDIPAKKKAGADLSQVKSMLTGLRFDKVYLADDAEVHSLQFDTRLKFELKNQSSYTVSAVKQGEKYFMRISAAFDGEVPTSITRDEAEEDLEKKSEVLLLRDKVEEFNSFHGSWVYELSEYAAKKIFYKKSDLIEDEEEPKKDS